MHEIIKTWTTPIPPPKGVLRRIDNDIAYYPSTGLIIWLNPQSTKLKSGDIAGSFHNGYIRIKITYKGKYYGILAHHIAYYKIGVCGLLGKWIINAVINQTTVGVNYV